MAIGATDPNAISPKSRLRSFIEETSSSSPTIWASTHLRSLGFGASLRTVRGVPERPCARLISEVSASELH